MKLHVNHGTEIELRDEQGRLVAVVYDLRSKTIRDSKDPNFMSIDKPANELAAEIAFKFNACG